MHFLSLETSTNIFSLSVSRDEKVLRFRNMKTAKVLENSMVLGIDRLLDSVGLTFDQLDAFAIGLGPGSFTSLRVGLSTVKAFCLATGKPLVGICSLDVIAAGVSDLPCDEICVLNDARRGMVYAALYGPKGRKAEPVLTSLDQVLEKVHGKTLFVGDALGLYGKDIEAAYKKCSSKTCEALFAAEKFWQPQAKIMAGLAWERLRKKEYDDAATLLPVYLYAQDCQVQK